MNWFPFSLPSCGTICMIFPVTFFTPTTFPFETGDIHSSILQWCTRGAESFLSQCMVLPACQYTVVLCSSILACNHKNSHIAWNVPSACFHHITEMEKVNYFLPGGIFLKLSFGPEMWTSSWHIDSWSLFLRWILNDDLQLLSRNWHRRCNLWLARTRLDSKYHSSIFPKWP